jgi:hypothetical protein
MVKKISSLLWSPEFITASIRAYHLTTSWANEILDTLTPHFLKYV